MTVQCRKKLRLKYFNYTNTVYVYFLTICTADKNQYLKNPEVAKIIIDGLYLRKKRNEIRLYCFCVMPDHIHVLMSMTEAYNKKLQLWVSAFKRYTTRIAQNKFGIKRLWQKNFNEHVVRREEPLLKVAEYIMDNPVRRGLATKRSDYPFSRIVDPLPICY